MDEPDEMEKEMNRVLDELNLEPALVEEMRQVWLEQLAYERRKREIH